MSPPAWKLATSEFLTPLRLAVAEPLHCSCGVFLSNEEIRRSLALALCHGRLLDLGCGENRLVREYRAAGGEGVGLDVHPWPGADLLVADSARLPYPDGGFETVTFVASLNHIPNREAVVREAARLLAPGGRAVVTMLSPAVGALWHRLAFWDPDRHERGMRPGERFGLAPAEVEALFVAAGLRPVARRRFSWGLNRLYLFEKPA